MDTQMRVFVGGRFRYLCVIGIVLLLFVWLLVCPQSAEASPSAYFANAPTGTATSPQEYSISTEDQLAALATTVNSGVTYACSTFTLQNDIAITSDHNGSTWGNWDPIGKTIVGDTRVARVFSGTFDGAGHTISNVFPLGPNSDASPSFYEAGLFGYLGENSVVRDLNVSGSIALDSNDAGPVVLAGGIAAQSTCGTLVGCSYSGTITLGKNTPFSSYVYAGGLVGSVDSSRNVLGTSEEGLYDTFSMCQCTSNATLDVACNGRGTGAPYAGGLVGYCGSGGEMVQSSSTSDVTVRSSSMSVFSGGLVGAVDGQSFTFDACDCTGSVTADLSGESNGASLYMGGILGSAGEASSSFGILARNCSSNCTFAVVTDENSSISELNIGGICGRVESITVKNCRADVGALAVSASSCACGVGGIVGVAVNGFLSNCYAAGSITVKGGSGNAAGIVATLGITCCVENCYNACDVKIETSNKFGNYDTHAGGIVGEVGVDDAHPIVVKDCYNSGSIFAGNFTYSASAGGIVGYLSDSGVDGCVNDGTVDGYANDSSTLNLGGIIGESLSVYVGDGIPTERIPITNCINQGRIQNDTSVTTGYELYAGGLSSVCGSATRDNVTGCANHGDFDITLDGSRACIGGLFGKVAGKAIPSGLTSDGDIVVTVANNSSGAYVGGCIGSIADDQSNTGEVHDLFCNADITVSLYGHSWATVGGVIGYGNSSVDVFDCGHVGTIEVTQQEEGVDNGSAVVGGILASYPGKSIINCFNWGNVEAVLKQGDARVGGITSGDSDNSPEIDIEVNIANCIQVGYVYAESSTKLGNSTAYAGGIVGKKTTDADEARVNYNYRAGATAAVAANCLTGIFEVGETLSYNNTQIPSTSYDGKTAPYTLTDESYREAMLDACNTWATNHSDESRIYGQWTTNAACGWPDLGQTPPDPITTTIAGVAENLNDYATADGCRSWGVFLWLCQARVTGTIPMMARAFQGPGNGALPCSSSRPATRCRAGRPSSRRR